MISFTPLLGINSPKLGGKNPLITPLRLYQKSKFTLSQIDQFTPLALYSPFIQTSRLLGKASSNRLQNYTNPPEIGWDNWQPIDQSPDHDNFDYKVDRSRYNSTDRSNQTNQTENPELDFFTTVLPTEFADLDPQLDSLPDNSIDVEIPTPTTKYRSTADTIQPQSPGKLQPKLVELNRKLLESNQIDQIEQPQSSVQSPQNFDNIQQQITQASPETVGEPTTSTESSLTEPLLGTTIDLSLDHLALNTINGPLTEPLLGTNSFTTETSIDMDLDVPRSPDLDLNQISRSVVDRTSSQENQIKSNLASPPELIPDPIVPNLLVPTIINPVITPQIDPLEPEVKTTIISESDGSPENITLFPVLEQIATATEIDPIPESSDKVRADPIAPNPINFSTIIDPQPPEVATTKLPLLEKISTATENIPSVMQSAVENVRESISDTLPVDGFDSPIINQTFTDPTQLISASFDDFAIANLDVPASTSLLPSGDLSPTTSPLLADLAPIATAPNQIAPEIQSPQQLNPATTQLNLAVDLSNIDRDSDPSVQLEPANPDIPESPRTLPAEALSTNLLPIPTPEQIATSPTSIETEADLQPTQLVSADTSPPNLPNPIAANQAPSALEQISRFTNEPTPANLESSPTPIIKSVHTLPAVALPLAESPLPWDIDLDSTIESSHTLSLNALQSNIDRSPPENIPLESTSSIALEQEKKENITEFSHEFSSEKLVASPLDHQSVINQPTADSPQNTQQLEHPSVNIIDESDDATSPSNNPIDNLTNSIQVEPLTTVFPTIGQAELSSTLIDNSIDINVDNSSDITIPAPTVGYATGGYVKDANHIDLQSIASSDTVSAMLTPGEFVINAKDAQKNLDLLTHINRGGEPEAVLPNTEIQSSIIESPPTSPDISPTSIQRKRNDLLISPSLQRDIGLQQLSPLTTPGLDTFESSQSEGSTSSPTYSPPSMVFRKPMSSSPPQYTGADTPDQWGSIEDLINGGSNNSDPFSFDRISPQQPDLESRSSPSMSPTISPQYAIPIRGFADGGEVTPSDISTTIEPVTHTIESPIANPDQQAENNDPAELEILAREIYHRLRQRLEIERERHGSYSGNLAW
jgi:hypothetical protein